MRLTNFLNNYGYMILGGAMILGFSAFKGAEVYTGKLLSPATVYFHGDPTDPDQVKNELLWNTTPNGQDCNNDEELACMIVVEDSDLNSSLQLDSVKVTLDATEGASSIGYIPERISGSGTPDPTIINRN